MAIESVETPHRRQIVVPSSTNDLRPHPSPTKSDIIVSRHSEVTDSHSPTTPESEMTERYAADEAFEYDEKVRTWPRKRTRHHHHNQEVTDNNDPARLATDMHNDSDRHAFQHDCNSTETIISRMTYEMPNYDYEPSSSCASAAEQILGASMAVPSCSQYCTTSPSTTYSFSIQQPFTAAAHDLAVPTFYSCSRPFQDDGHRLRVVEDSRCAVDILFDSLYGPTQQSEPETSPPASVRTFPVSPHVPSHNPYVQSHHLNDGHRAQPADLSNEISPFLNTPPASAIHGYHR